MTSRAHARRSSCPIAYSLDIIGDRWTLLVMRDFVFKGRRHFGELLDGEERIASNVLTDRLRQLEMHGIVTRSDDPVDRRRVQYTLTVKGLALVPAMLELILWGATYDRHTAAPPEFIERLRTDRDGLLREILAGHRAPARNPVD